jgi:hypothetical protein
MMHLILRKDSCLSVPSRGRRLGNPKRSEMRWLKDIGSREIVGRISILAILKGSTLLKILPSSISIKVTWHILNNAISM